MFELRDELGTRIPCWYHKFQDYCLDYINEGIGFCDIYNNTVLCF